MNRSQEFSALAARAIDPAYRRLWLSQAEEYGGKVSRQVAEPGPAFRTDAESSWAQLFDNLGVTYEYRGNTYGPHASATRFWFPARAAWLKVLSQEPTEREFAAARGLARDGCRVYMVTGWPARKRFGVWVVAREGEFMAVRADFRDLALANLLGVSFGRLYEGMGEVRGDR